LPAPPERPRRLAYLGSPAAAVPTLAALVEAGFAIPLVVTRPDRRRGRGSATTPSPVKAAALEFGLDVTDDVDALLDVPVDLGIVVAYGKLIKPHLLTRIPFVNLHFSLLPRWRGAAPVERAVLAGDERTGVCVMALEEGLDTGGIYRSAEVTIGPDDTVDGLRSQLVELGTGLLLDCLRNGFGVCRPQTGEPVYAAKIDPAELALDWSRPAAVVLRTVHLGRAWTTFRGRRLLVHDAVLADATEFAGVGLTGEPGSLRVDGGAVVVETGAGQLVLRQVQPEGKGRQDARAWSNGARPEPGERLGR
jgi:methionyl-tRNA formyltransferase